jgi:microcystin-dependent protein
MCSTSRDTTLRYDLANNCWQLATGFGTAAFVDTGTSGNTALLNSSIAGFVMAYTKNSPPTGWLECNGAAISRTTYATLFAIIGTTFGSGDGSTTFNIPDLRAEFIRGWDNGRGVDSGRVFGSAQSVQTNNLDKFSTTLGSGGEQTVPQDGSYSGMASTGYNAVPFIGIKMKLTGLETRPRNIALMYCIKY